MNKQEKVLTNADVLELGLDKVDVITSDMLEGYTSIGYSAFAGCTFLTSIILPNSVTSIGDSAFEDCYSLTSITIPNSVTSIGGNAFAWCSAITFVTIPVSVTSIGYKAFAWCFSLTSITIQNSVINIRNNAFYDCFKLKNVIIGNKTYKTQEVTNGRCKAYKAFNSDFTCRDFRYEEGETYEIEDEPILCRRGFHACLRLTDVFNHYRGNIGKDIVVHEVELEGVSNETNKDDSKVVAKKISIGKRIL